MNDGNHMVLLTDVNMIDLERKNHEESSKIVMAIYWEPLS
jgi:hypothetical protein